MYYVYLLKSVSEPAKHYVGFSSDLRQRLSDHNAGPELVTRESTTTVILSEAKDPRLRIPGTPAWILRFAQDDGAEVWISSGTTTAIPYKPL